MTAKYRSIRADDDITTCNFVVKCLIPKLLRVTVLLRYYAITARSVLSPSFLLRYYGITAKYSTLLSYWYQNYCKSKCFILITLLRQGTLLVFLNGIKATVKASVSFVLHYYAITARYFTLLSYWHQSYCKSKCFILITLLCYYGKVLHSSHWHQSNCKSKCFFRITLLSYYGKVLHSSFFLASKLL